MKIEILGIEIDLSIKKPNHCVIKGKCKYKFFSECYFNWPNEIKAYAEDCTCLINEKLRDKI